MEKLEKKCKRDIVKKYYPEAEVKNVGCKNGSFYEVWCGKTYLGKGKSKNEAWSAAYNNTK